VEFEFLSWRDPETEDAKASQLIMAGGRASVKSQGIKWV
jgi:hypothetical protein